MLIRYSSVLDMPLAPPTHFFIRSDDIPAPILAALDDPAKSAALVIREDCTWTNAGWEYGDTWETACGNAWTFTDGSPEENDAKFCMYCGGNLTPIRAAQATEEAPR